MNYLIFFQLSNNLSQENASEHKEHCDGECKEFISLVLNKEKDL